MPLKPSLADLIVYKRIKKVNIEKLNATIINDNFTFSLTNIFSFYKVAFSFSIGVFVLGARFLSLKSGFNRFWLDILIGDDVRIRNSLF